MARRAPRSDAGFGVIEVVIAIFVIGMVLTTLAMTTTLSSAKLSKQRSQTYMLTAAQSVWEQVKDDRRWVDSCALPVGVDTATCSMPGGLLSEATSNLPPAPVTRQIEPAVQISATAFDDDSDGLGAADHDKRRPDYIKITVTVTAKDAVSHTPIPTTELKAVTSGGLVVPWQDDTRSTVTVQACGVMPQADERQAIATCDSTGVAALDPGGACASADPLGEVPTKRPDLTAWCVPGLPAQYQALEIRAIEDMQLTLVPLNGDPPVSGTTTAEGTVQFSDVKAGDYRIDPTWGTGTAPFSTPVPGFDSTNWELWRTKTLPGTGDDLSPPMPNSARLSVKQQSNESAILVFRPKAIGQIRIRHHSGAAVTTSPGPPAKGYISDDLDYAVTGGFWSRPLPAPAGREKFVSPDVALDLGKDPRSEGWAWTCHRTDRTFIGPWMREDLATAPGVSRDDFVNWDTRPYCGAHQTEIHHLQHLKPVYRRMTYRSRSAYKIFSLWHHEHECHNNPGGPHPGNGPLCGNDMYWWVRGQSGTMPLPRPWYCPPSNGCVVNQRRTDTSDNCVPPNCWTVVKGAPGGVEEPDWRNYMEGNGNPAANPNPLWDNLNFPVRNYLCSIQSWAACDGSWVTCESWAEPPRDIHCTPNFLAEQPIDDVPGGCECGAGGGSNHTHVLGGLELRKGFQDYKGSVTVWPDGVSKIDTKDDASEQWEYTPWVTSFVPCGTDNPPWYDCEQSWGPWEVVSEATPWPPAGNPYYPGPTFKHPNCSLPGNTDPQLRCGDPLGTQGCVPAPNVCEESYTLVHNSAWIPNAGTPPSGQVVDLWATHEHPEEEHREWSTFGSVGSGLNAAGLIRDDDVDFNPATADSPKSDPVLVPMRNSALFAAAPYVWLDPFTSSFGAGVYPNWGGASTHLFATTQCTGGALCAGPGTKVRLEPRREGT